MAKANFNGGMIYQALMQGGDIEMIKKQLIFDVVQNSPDGVNPLDSGMYANIGTACRQRASLPYGTDLFEAIGKVLGPMAEAYLSQGSNPTGGATAPVPSPVAPAPPVYTPVVPPYTPSPVNPNPPTELPEYGNPGRIRIVQNSNDGAFWEQFRKELQTRFVDKIASGDLFSVWQAITGGMLDSFAVPLVGQERWEQIKGDVARTGASTIIMLLTGNFPMAAMGYFASTRLTAGAAKQLFNGTMTGAATIDGVPLTVAGIAIPQGLPNDIFDDFRFTCFDRLTGKWWPTDEIQPLAYQGADDQYRWVVLDRVSQKIYHANWIKKPNIYV